MEVSFSQNDEHIDYRNLNKFEGSIYDMAGYIFLPIFHLLGADYETIEYYMDKNKNGADLFTRGLITYKNAVATFRTGLGIKTEGQLIITGTEGYLYVPAPWWKTDYFEVRYEDLRNTKKYFWQYEGEGFRYELIEFLRRINTGRFETDYSLPLAEARALEKVNIDNVHIF